MKKSGKRLIDADALVCMLVSVKQDYAEESNDLHEKTVNCLIKILQKETICPTIDAVPVVRCKDCKYWESVNFVGTSYGTCTLLMVGMKMKDYCSYGERRCDNDP